MPRTSPTCPRSSSHTRRSSGGSHESSLPDWRHTRLRPISRIALSSCLRTCAFGRRRCHTKGSTRARLSRGFSNTGRPVPTAGSSRLCPYKRVGKFHKLQGTRASCNLYFPDTGRLGPNRDTRGACRSHMGRHTGRTKRGMSSACTTDCFRNGHFAPSPRSLRRRRRSFQHRCCKIVDTFAPCGLRFLQSIRRRAPTRRTTATCPYRSRQREAAAPRAMARSCPPLTVWSQKWAQLELREVPGTWRLWLCCAYLCPQQWFI